MRKILFFILISFSVYALQLTEEGRLVPAAQELVSLMEVPQDLTLNELTSYLLKEWMQGGKERWEMDRRFEDKREQALPLLEQLGCIGAIWPQEDHYSYALVLGATGAIMQSRLDFLYEQWQRGVRFDQIVLLTGARELDPRIEKIPEGVQTETELFVYLFDRHPLKGLSPHVVIDAPKQILEDGTIRRPTTDSTVIQWLKSEPMPGNCLAISTQPFVGCQEAKIRAVIPPQFHIEAVGPQIQKEYPLSIYLDSFAKWLRYEQEEPPSAYLSHPAR